VVEAEEKVTAEDDAVALQMGVWGWGDGRGKEREREKIIHGGGKKCRDATITKKQKLVVDIPKGSKLLKCQLQGT
jgi:hypothetical protein